MKRILILIMLLVLAAAVINLVVALGFWQYGKRPSQPNFINNSGIIQIGYKELSVWRDSRQPGWPSQPDSGYMFKFFGITHRMLSLHNSEYSGSRGNVNFKINKMDNYIISNTEFGWPLRCIVREQWTEAHWPKKNIKRSEAFVIFGVSAPNRVLWIGMIINILYYYFSIALAFICWSYIRRGLRRLHNRCLKCGYNLRGDISQGCPECGWGREAEA